MNQLLLEEKISIVKNRINQTLRMEYEQELNLKIEEVVGKNPSQIEFYQKSIANSKQVAAFLESELQLLLVQPAEE